MGRFVQPLPNNWKLYVENVKDTYHASILHTFLTTFRISRLTQGGGVLVSADGGNHSSYTIAMPRRRQRQRLQGAADPLRPGRQVRAGRSQRARLGRGVRRPHPAADPVGVPGLHPAADPQLPGRAPRRAARRRQDGPGVDLFRLRGRHAGDEPAAAEAAEPGRPGRLHLDGGRLHRRLRAARHRGGGRRGVGDRDGRQHRPKARRRAPPKPRCAASGRPIGGTWVTRATAADHEPFCHPERSEGPSRGSRA